MIERQYLKWTEHGLTKVYEKETAVVCEQNVFGDWINANVAFTSKHFASNAAGHPISLRTSKESTILAMEIFKISIDTFFAAYVNANGDSVCVPVFQPRAGAAQMKFDFAPPAGVRMFFVLAQTTEGPAFYLPLVSSKQTFHMLPMPNVYRDGKLCIGEFEHELDVLGDFHAGYAAFQTNKWNTDLMGNLNSTQEVMQFNPTTMKWIEKSHDVFLSYSSLISNVAFNWIKEIL